MSIKSGFLLVLSTTLALSVCGVVEAAPNDGRGPQTNESKHAKFCRDLKAAYDENIKYYSEKPSTRSQWRRTAQNIKTLAEGNNCGWAA